MSTTELFGEYQASTETPSSAPTDRKKGAVALHDEGSRGFLGTVRLRNDQTGEVILVPTPSNDPNDPLNWYGLYFLLFLIVYLFFFSLSLSLSAVKFRQLKPIIGLNGTKMLWLPSSAAQCSCAIL